MNVTASDAGRAASTAGTGLIAYFAGNPVTAKLLMLFLIVGGVIAAFHLPVQNFPDIDARTIQVAVRSPHWSDTHAS